MTEHVPSQLTDWHSTEVRISLGNPSSTKKPDIDGFSSRKGQLKKVIYVTCLGTMADKTEAHDLRIMEQFLEKTYNSSLKG